MPELVAGKLASARTEKLFDAIGSLPGPLAAPAWAPVHPAPPVPTPLGTARYGTRRFFSAQASFAAGAVLANVALSPIAAGLGAVLLLATGGLWIPIILIALLVGILVHSIKLATRSLPGNPRATLYGALAGIVIFLILGVTIGLVVVAAILAFSLFPVGILGAAGILAIPIGGALLTLRRVNEGAGGRDRGKRPPGPPPLPEMPVTTPYGTTARQPERPPEER